jgi:hypothetical protein
MIVVMLVRMYLYTTFSIGGFIAIHDHSMKAELLDRLTAFWIG